MTFQRWRAMTWASRASISLLSLISPGGRCVRPVTGSKLIAAAGSIRTYVRVERSVDPPRRPRFVLRLGRAARRAAPARAAGDRRNGRRPRRELRGEGVRRRDGDGPEAGAAPLPARRRRAAALRGVLGGEQGRLRDLRGHDAARRGTVDRRGVPRRAWDGTEHRVAARDRGPSAAARA